MGASRPADMHSTPIKQSDSLDITCANMNAFWHKRLLCQSSQRSGSVARGAQRSASTATRVLVRPVLLGSLSSSAWRSPPWWRQHRPATGGRTTPTGIPSLPFCRRPPPTLQSVIIREFFTRRDRAQGFKIYLPLLDDRLAVRCARVIEIPRLIAPHPSINDCPLIHGK